ncbi:MAG: KOW domain-containing RNA-binding protein [Christensenella sp.]|nr:KOW domain-containing RNA-binding protein [Christensenella sp.]
MKDDSVTIGRLAVSRAGRDAGKVFLVTEVIDDRYVMIANGDLRKLGKPKKKKVKHLDFLPVVLENIGEKLETGKKVFDAELRSAIKNATEPQKEE